MKTPRAGRRAPEPGLPPPLLAVVIGGALLLVLAPPDSPGFWGVNGLRSLTPGAALALVCAALASAAVPALRSRAATIRWGAAIAIVLVVAFPLREQSHLLGDTLLRLKHQRAVALGGLPAGFGSGWERLHAQPLDGVVDVLIPVALQRLGLKLRDAISALSSGLALAFLAVAWRLAGRLGASAANRSALALALALSGALEGFAGYAEVAGLVAVTALWWWTEMLAPLASASQAGRTALAFLALILTHRLGAVMLVPQLWRALGPFAPGDQPSARRALAGLTGVALVVATWAAFWGGTARQLGLDVGEILGALRPWPTHGADTANGLALLAPLMPVALAAAPGWRAWIREPSSAWVAAAALPLLAAQIWVFPAGQSGLGAMRDWDSGILLGLTLTVAAGIALGRLPEARLRATLSLALPLLTLVALGWVAVNADAGAATRRALALLRSPAALTVPQRAHLHAYFGQRGMDELRPDLAAPHYETAYDLAGNPRRALFAAEAYLASGDLGNGRRMLERARSGAPLSPELERSFQELEERALRLESSIATPADSIAAPR